MPIELNILDLISLVSSIASIIIAVGAVWLSIVFFQWSDRSNKATQEAAKDIDSSVKRLEALFGSLYTGTFSIMSDTVADMRRHMWSKPEPSNTHVDINAEIESRVEGIREEVVTQLSAIIEKSVKPDQKFKEIQNVVEGAITSTTAVKEKVEEETIRSEILQYLQRKTLSKEFVYADDIVSYLRDNYSLRKVLGQIRRLRSLELIEFEGDDLLPRTKIYLKN